MTLIVIRRFPFHPLGELLAQAVELLLVEKPEVLARVQREHLDRLA